MAKRFVVAVAAIIAMLAATARPSRSTEEWSFETFQPIWTDNDLCLSRVTVLTFNSGSEAVMAVLATCAPNCVMSDGADTQQRNAAFEVGLRAEVTFNTEKEPPLFGDTLRVVLRATKPPADIGDRNYGTIVAATVQCILFNAARSPAIKFVALRVEGEARYRKYGGVFRMGPFRNGPSARQFPDS